MNVYIQVCVALEDHNGLQRENIFVCQRRESSALRNALQVLDLLALLVQNYKY